MKAFLRKEEGFFLASPKSSPKERTSEEADDSTLSFGEGRGEALPFLYLHIFPVGFANIYLARAANRLFVLFHLFPLRYPSR